MAKTTDPKKTPSVAALKGQITKLTNRVDTLETEAQEALAAKDAAETALTEAQSEVEGLNADRDALVQTKEAMASDIESLRARIASLEATNSDLANKVVQAEAAKLARPQTTEEVFGSVRAGGLLVMAGADLVDTQWRKPQEARSQYAVDFTGPSAEFLATRITRAPREQLADGTWRILVPDDRTAATVVGGAKKYMTENPHGTTVHSAPGHCRPMLALAATRPAGYGLVTIAGQPAMLALRGSDSMKVSTVKDPSGRVVALKIAP